MSTALMPGFVDDADNLYKISRGRDSTGEENLCSLLGRGSSMPQNHQQQQQHRHQQQQRRHSSALPSFFPPSRFSVSGGNGGGGGGCGAIGAAPPVHRDDRFRERSLSESGERHQAVGNNINNNNVSNNNNNNSSRYKTELCRPFQESGACKYGDKCQFAHGLHELRALVRHPKYKTELCRTFHTIGFCPYGPRCHFIHNADEKRVPDPPRLTQNSTQPELLGGPLRSPHALREDHGRLLSVRYPHFTQHNPRTLSRPFCVWSFSLAVTAPPVPGDPHEPCGLAVRPRCLWK
uniref:mRNA decay activator protein ZFP36 n=1 Tax=Eptatretus burgeri TaxID=7764 RepID=A0A8C4RAQ1_EPTBU